MKSKKMLCTLALTTVIFQGILSGNTKAAVTAENRIYGSNRYETSSAISQKGWVTSDTVILASGEAFADALCAGPLAKKYNSPVLLTSSKSINDATLNELSRLQAKNIIIIGGIGAISAEVEEKLKSKGYNIDRIAGQNRYETSALIAARLDKPSSVVIASGENFPDALSISTIASKLGMPILLSPKTGLSDYAKEYITNNGITKSYIVGGTGVLSGDIDGQLPAPTRLAGQNRYGTNLAIIKEFESSLSYNNVYLSSDQSFADALSGAVLASNSNAPIILTNGSIDTNIQDYLKEKMTSNTKVIALGGEAVVSNTLIETVIASGETTGQSGDSTPPPANSITDLSDGNSHIGNYVISTTGTFGDSMKTTSISGNVSIQVSTAATTDEIVLQNMNILGTLTVDFGSGNVVLNNVTVNGIDVSNVGSNSLHVKGNSVIGNLTVNDPNNDAHIVVEDNATISAATVFSGANLEVAATATNNQPFSNITVAPALAPTASNQVMLTGTFDIVNVTTPAKVVLAPKAQIATKLIATAPLEFTAPETATVAKVDIKPSKPTDTFILNGNLDNVNVSAVSNVQVQSGIVKVSSDTNAAVNLTVAQSATVNTIAGSAMTLTGEGTKITREKSTEAKVAYLKLGNGTLREFTIVDLPAAITAQKLLDNLLVSAFAKAQILDASGNQINGTTVIDSTMTLKVIAEDELTVNNYSLKFAALPTFSENYPKATTGPNSSKTILVSTKANEQGRVYMVAVPSGSAAPTSAQVKAGTDASGKFVANYNQDVILGEEALGKIIVDKDNTSYDIYAVLLGSNGTLQQKPVKLTANSPIAAEPNVLNITWPIGTDEVVTYNHKGISIGFDADLQLPTDWSQILVKDSNGVQVPISKVSYINLKNELEIVSDSLTNGQYTIFIPENTLKDASGSKYNKAISFTFNIQLPNIDIMMLKNEMENAKGMLDMPVGTNPGDYSDQSAKDALIKALSAAEALVQNSSATQEDINSVFYELQRSEKVLSDSMITGLIPYDYKGLIASDNLNQIVKVELIGAGDFIANLSPSNIILGEDFTGLTVKSVAVDNNYPWQANIELAGSLTPVKGYGTITINAAGLTGSGTSQDVTTKIVVLDPSVLNLLWPIDEQDISYYPGGISIGFDTAVQLPTDWSQIVVKDLNGVQIPLISVHSGFTNNELEIEFDSVNNQQYTISIPENTLTDISGTKHNKAINFTFSTELPSIDIEMLKNQISNLQSATNIPVGDRPGDCSQVAKDALISALSAAQAIVDQGTLTQEDITNAFFALMEAEKSFFSSIVSGLMPSDFMPVTASNAFNQTINVNIIGAGGFSSNLSPANITLGEDFSELVVKSVVVDSMSPWQASIELTGSLTSVSGFGTITLNAAGWNGMPGSYDITAKVSIIDPSILNVTWPINDIFNEDNNFTYNYGGMNIGFDSDVQLPRDWSQIIVKDSNGIQVPISSIHNGFSNNELEIDFASIKNGQYTIFIPENTLTDASGNKHNKAISFTFNIELPNVDIEMLKNQITNAQFMTYIPVGDKVGDCSDQAAKDALINAISAAQTIVESGTLTPEEINNAFYALQEAQKVMSNSIITGLMASDYKPVTASSTFSQIISVNIAGSGRFAEGLNPSNIILGGDFAGLTVKSAVTDIEYPWNAKIELEGNLSFVSGYGTITVNGAGLTGMSTSHDITAKVTVVDPNALNVTWPMSNNFNSDNPFVYNHNGISIGFDSEVQLPTNLSQIIVKDSTGTQLPITGAHYINLKNELELECSALRNGQYTIYIPENTLTDISGSKYNKAINFTFNVQLPNVDIEVLKYEIANAQNMTNIPVGTNVGDCSQAAKDALINALSAAQAVVAKGTPTQEDINNTFYTLQQAEHAVGASIIAGIASPVNTVFTSTVFNQIVELNAAGGKFLSNLDSSYIKLGGDFEGLTVKSVVTDFTNPWSARIELAGSLNSTLGYGTITVSAAGWDSPNGTYDSSIKINVLQANGSAPIQQL